MTVADKFTTIFREEHRAVRDTILALVSAFRGKEKDKIQPLLDRLSALTGPHFRYEEESLYPELTVFFTDEYVEKLYSDHDMAIANAKRLITLAETDSLSDEESRDAVRILQSIMPHVSDCDGLSILIETLPEETIQAVLDTRTVAREENLALVPWAEGPRMRPVSF